MQWRIAEAKQRFAELIRAAGHEPQIILNRDRVVAAVIDVETLQEFEAWRAGRQRTSIAEASAEIRRIAAETDYQIPTGDHLDRPNAFVDVLDELSR